MERSSCSTSTMPRLVSDMSGGFRMAGSPDALYIRRASRSVLGCPDIDR